MELKNKSTRLRLLDFRSPQMRAFHMTWFAFFLCFFAWFGVAPLMKVIREEMHLTRDQIGWCVIGSVSITVLARLVIGWVCDRIGPRYAYTGLLLVGSIPVMGIGLAESFEAFLAFRVMIGMIGAAFVITQYHTSLMFAPNCVGTANATSAGWGNMGGGVTQLVMPLLLAGFVSVLGLSAEAGWRACMVAAGVVCALMGVAYFLLTQDTPDGNFSDLRARGLLPGRSAVRGTFLEAARDSRVWILFIVYAACFGIELTVNGVAALYFADGFEYFRSLDGIQAMKTAGMIASVFGLMNLFARTLGGWFGDRFGSVWGLSGRTRWLFLTLFCEGLALMVFSQMSVLTTAIPALIVFSLFVQMSEGATFSVVPFISQRALGSVSGIVGAGGNAGAVAAGFLFKPEAITWSPAFFILGALVTCCSFLTFAIHFSEAAETDARRAIQSAVDMRNAEPELVSA